MQPTMRMFAVYDSKAEAYLQPFFAKTAAMAVRMFETAANDSGHDFNRFAADYTLFEVGAWFEQTGLVEGHDLLVNLGNALQLQRQERPQLAAVEE